MRILFFILTVLVGLVCLYASSRQYSLLNEYREIMPQVPDVRTGNVRPINVHGKIIFVTIAQDQYIRDLQEVENYGFPSLVIFAVLYRISKNK